MGQVAQERQQASHKSRYAGGNRLDPIGRLDLRLIDGPPAPRTAQRSACCSDLWSERPTGQHLDLSRIAACPGGTALWGICTGAADCKGSAGAKHSREFGQAPGPGDAGVADPAWRHCCSHLPGQRVGTPISGFCVLAAEPGSGVHDGDCCPDWQGTPERQRHCGSGTNHCWGIGHRERHRFRNDPSWSGIYRPGVSWMGHRQQHQSAPEHQRPDADRFTEIGWSISADAAAGRTNRGKVPNPHGGRAAPGDWRNRIWTFDLVGSAGAAGVGRCQGISDFCDGTICWSRVCCPCPQRSTQRQHDCLFRLDGGWSCTAAQ